MEIKNDMITGDESHTSFMSPRLRGLLPSSLVGGTQMTRGVSGSSMDSQRVP